MTDKSQPSQITNGRRCKCCGNPEDGGNPHSVLRDSGMCEYCDYVHKKGDEESRWNDDMRRIDMMKRNEWPTPETKLVARWLDRYTVPEILRLMPVGYDGKQPEAHTEKVDQLAKNIEKKWDDFWNHEVAPRLIDACVHPVIIELTAESEKHVDWIYIAIKVTKMQGASQ